MGAVDCAGWTGNVECSCVDGCDDNAAADVADDTDDGEARRTTTRMKKARTRPDSCDETT